MSLDRGRLPHTFAALAVAASTGLGLTACGGADSAGPDQGTTLPDINEEGREGTRATSMTSRTM